MLLQLLQRVACKNCMQQLHVKPRRKTSGSATAEGPRDALVSRNSATTKHPI